MGALLRRIRGALSLGAVWGVSAYLLVQGFYALEQILSPGVSGVPASPTWLGVAGAFAGALFGAGLAVFQRHRSVRSASRVVATLLGAGGVGGGLMLVTTLTLGSPLAIFGAPQVLVPGLILGSVFGFGTLAMAQRTAVDTEPDALDELMPPDPLTDPVKHRRPLDRERAERVF